MHKRSYYSSVIVAGEPYYGLEGLMFYGAEILGTKEVISLPILTTTGFLSRFYETGEDKF
jgi:hypothetical protein